MGKKSLKQQFLDWCSGLYIDSKDKGLIKFSPDVWYDSQKYVVDTIFDTIEQEPNVRTFIILKGRQEGITTVVNAIDIFWNMKFPNINGVILSANDKIEKNMRNLLRTYYTHLPKTHKVPLKANNRDRMAFVNGSRLEFMHMATRDKDAGNLGTSYACNYLHATEVSRFNNVDDFNTFISTLSELHPNRLYIMESTAYGYNSFYDLWENAKDSNTQKAIFVGWWLKNTYSIPKDSPDYKKYSYPLEEWEKENVRLIKKYYGYNIKMEQIAWWRRFLAENMKTGEMTSIDMMLQEYPYTEDDAFRMTGSKFFNTKILSERKKNVCAPAYTLQPVFGDEPEATRFMKVKNGAIKIWESPDIACRYVCACDPAAGERGDNTSIMVFKVFNDKMYQVLEYATNQTRLLYTTWALISIAGMYRASYILEANGIGKAMMQLIDQYRANIIKKIQKNEMPEEGLSIRDFAMMLRDEYLYKRVDSLSSTFARQWVTTAELKEQIMYKLESVFSTGELIIRSHELVREMEFIEKDGSYIGALEGRNDDRVMCAAMAVEHWFSLRNNLITEEEWLKKQEEIRKKAEEQNNPRLISVQRFLKKHLESKR